MRRIRVQARGSGGRCGCRKGREARKAYATAPIFLSASPSGHSSRVGHSRAEGRTTRGRAIIGSALARRCLAASSRRAAGKRAVRRSALKRTACGRGILKLLAGLASKGGGNRCPSSGQLRAVSEI